MPECDFTGNISVRQRSCSVTISVRQCARLWHNSRLFRTARAPRHLEQAVDRGGAHLQDFAAYLHRGGGFPIAAINKQWRTMGVVPIVTRSAGIVDRQKQEVDMTLRPQKQKIAPVCGQARAPLAPSAPGKQLRSRRNRICITIRGSRCAWTGAVGPYGPSMGSRARQRHTICW